MLACGTAFTGFGIFLLAAGLVGLVVPVLNLGALTAAAMRPGRAAPGLRRMGWLAVAIGCLTTLLTPLIGPIALVGLAEVAAGFATIRLNARV